MPLGLPGCRRLPRIGKPLPLPPPPAHTPSPPHCPAAALLPPARPPAQAELTQKRLMRAEKLTGALADEAVRWRAQSEAISTNMQQLVGDVFLSAACISYIGAFSGEGGAGAASAAARTTLGLGRGARQSSPP